MKGIMMDVSLIVTQGPYSTFFERITSHNIVSGIRFNTIMPIPENQYESKLQEMFDMTNKYHKDLWVDLKGRQLRVMEVANTPFTSVTISHEIELELPVIVYFDNGSSTGKIVAIDGNKLILEGYVGRLLVPGEGINIPHPSLRYVNDSVLSEKDVMYLELCKKIGIHKFMLSFVQTADDINYVKELYPEAILNAKIENKQGLDNLDQILEVANSIMVARGDLFNELDYPHDIVLATKKMIEAGPERAILASRILLSLLKDKVPACADLMELSYLYDLGYRQFMIGDDICFDEDMLNRAMRIFEMMFRS
jgi:hypothetical protein